MKKKLLMILLLCISSMNLTACTSEETGTQKKDKDIEEYNIDDFGALYEKTNVLFEKESEYLTDDELYSDKGYSIYKKCSEETGLPFKKAIRLRGKKMNSMKGFLLESTDGKYSISCFFNEDSLNESLFINDGDNIVVSGIFSENANSYGCLTNATIESPQNIEIVYENNIDAILSDYEHISRSLIVQGEISTILSLEEFEQGMEIMKSTVTYEHQDYYYDTVAQLQGESGSIYFMYKNDEYPNLKVGDKIVTPGYVYDLMHLKHLDGTVEILSGLMGNVYDIYTFQ